MIPAQRWEDRIGLARGKPGGSTGIDCAAISIAPSIAHSSGSSRLHSGESKPKWGNA